MQPAADKFSKILDEVEFNNAQAPIITNVTASKEVDGEKLKSLLVNQLLSPVRWVDSQIALEAEGVDRIIEVGPSTVLKGLMRSHNRKIAVESCGDLEAINRISEE
jgi:[acyl-carrier-protein] S-malonyltransferase